MNFDWDPSKQGKVLAERGIDFADAVTIFAGPVLVKTDTRQDYGEVRMIAIGQMNEVFVTVVDTDRGDTRWIITAWPANRKECAEWQRSHLKKP
ncbi:BrnT family toxin [Methylobacterium sp. 88A]|uniref:BrnT family toxin n=1 Tax=Methylobacterium sp. 88A TaxID=1131813 RepID=UPI000376B53A|nr:BrnT family toxin [Methylobacterium sp. 88A]